jgi:hypothetical protein
MVVHDACLRQRGQRGVWIIMFFKEQVVDEG